METSPLFELLRRFAATMARTFESNEVLFELVEGVVECVGAEAAGVSVATADGRLEFVTASSQRVIELEKIQQRDQAGPCVVAYRTSEVVAVADIAVELDMWPEYQRAADRAGMRSVLGVPLAVGDVRVGSLNVYDGDARKWTDETRSEAHVLADVATAYLVRAGELHEATQLAAQLQRALDSRIVIEQAKGVVSRANAISIDDAFSLMREHARRTNTKLRDLAQRVAHDGFEIPSIRE